MPITARLSRKFYERFGDDVVGELIDLLNLVDTGSRSELRELNEQNFARFDAKLEQRTAELRADITKLRAELRADITKLRAELRADIETLRPELRADIEKLRTDLRAEIAVSKEGMLRWMIGLWLTQMLAFAGLWLSRS